MTDFPKEMFVKFESEETEPETGWWLCDDKLENYAQTGETVKIGVYKLVEVRKVTAEVVIKSRKMK